MIYVFIGEVIKLSDWSLLADMKPCVGLTDEKTRSGSVYTVCRSSATARFVFFAAWKFLLIFQQMCHLEWTCLCSPNWICLISSCLCIVSGSLHDCLMICLLSTVRPTGMLLFNTAQSENFRPSLAAWRAAALCSRLGQSTQSVSLSAV